MKTHILKFGGSSLSNSEKIRNVGTIIKKYLVEKQILPIIILSAISNTTTLLIECAIEASAGREAPLNLIREKHLAIINELQLDQEVEISICDLLSSCNDILRGVFLIKELSPATQDMIMSYGERMSVRIVAGYLNKLNLSAKFIDAPDIGLTVKGVDSYGSTTKQITGVEITEKSIESIRLYLKKFIEDRVIPVITGFIAINESHRIVTLGRGGSDLSASIFGAALNVDRVEIWTDTCGILNGDPRLIVSPAPIRFLTFEEASEMAHFGAKVLHPRTIKPAMEANIPVAVCNSYVPNDPGTLICNHLPKKNPSQLLVGITLKYPVTVVDIKATQMMGQYGFLSKIFCVFERNGISVDVISTSEVSVSVTLDKDASIENLEHVKESLRNVADICIQNDRTTIALIGNPEKSTDIIEKACSTLKRCGVQIEMISLSASKLNTSLVIAREKSDMAYKALHAQFFQNQI